MTDQAPPLSDENPLGVMLSKLAQAQLDRDMAIKRAETAEASLERCREALTPFAEMAPHFIGKRGNRPYLPGHTVYHIASGGLADAEITVADFLRAFELVESRLGGLPSLTKKE